MAEIVLSFLMAYSFDQASILAEGYCYALDELTRNSTLYNETGAARRKGEIVDSYDLIYPCLFEEGNFTIPSEIYYEHKASSKVIKNLYEYINMMDKSHKTYKDAYSIIDVLDESSS